MSVKFAERREGAQAGIFSNFMITVVTEYWKKRNA